MYEAVRSAGVHWDGCAHGGRSSCVRTCAGLRTGRCGGPVRHDDHSHQHHDDTDVHDADAVQSEPAARRRHRHGRRHDARLGGVETNEQDPAPNEGGNAPDVDEGAKAPDTEAGKTTTTPASPGAGRTAGGAGLSCGNGYAYIALGKPTRDEFREGMEATGLPAYVSEIDVSPSKQQIIELTKGTEWAGAESDDKKLQRLRRGRRPGDPRRQAARTPGAAAPERARRRGLRGDPGDQAGQRHRVLARAGLA